MPSVCVQAFLSVTPVLLSKFESLPAIRGPLYMQHASELQCTCADNVENLEVMEGSAEVKGLPMASAPTWR